MAKTSSRPFITINATEVASAIGRHKRKTKGETLQKVWERTDYQTFCISNALENEEEVIAIIDRHWKEARDENEEDFSSILFEDWDKQEDTLVKMLSEIFPESGKPKASFVPLREEIRILIKVKTDSNLRNSMLLREEEVTEVDINREIIKLTKNEKKPVSESVKEICEKRNIQKDETKRALQSEINKKRGEALQDRTIKHFEKKNNVKVIAEIPFEKVMEYEGVKWRIKGRIDGKNFNVKEDQVIEVKNRTDRYYCEDYERIQLQTYMFICGKQKGLFLERLKGRQKATVFRFHAKEWDEEVTPALKEFVSELRSQIETYRVLLDDNKRYYVTFPTTATTTTAAAATTAAIATTTTTTTATTPESLSKRRLSNGFVNSSNKEKNTRIEKNEEQDTDPDFEPLSQ